MYSVEVWNDDFQVEQEWFMSPDECYAWADDMGYLNHDDYIVTVWGPEDNLLYDGDSWLDEQGFLGE